MTTTSCHIIKCLACLARTTQNEQKRPPFKIVTTHIDILLKQRKTVELHHLCYQKCTCNIYMFLFVNAHDMVIN